MSVASRVNFCTPIAITMKIGIISSPTMNALDWTSVVNSEVATMSALFRIT